MFSFMFPAPFPIDIAYVFSNSSHQSSHQSSLFRAYLILPIRSPYYFPNYSLCVLNISHDHFLVCPQGLRSQGCITPSNLVLIENRQLQGEMGSQGGLMRFCGCASPQIDEDDSSLAKGSVSSLGDSKAQNYLVAYALSVAPSHLFIDACLRSSHTWMF